MPTILRLTLLPQTAPRLRLNEGPAQGWFLALIRSLDPAWAEALHDKDEKGQPGRHLLLRPYTLSPLYTPHAFSLEDDDLLPFEERMYFPTRREEIVHIPAGQPVSLRVALLYDEDAQRLCDELARRDVMRNPSLLPPLGGAACTLLSAPCWSVTNPPAHPPVSSPEVLHADWEVLYQAPAAERVEIAFLTTTDFRWEKRDLTYCTAGDLLGRWRVVWETFAPSGVPTPQWQEDEEPRLARPAPLVPARAAVKGGDRSGYRGAVELFWDRPVAPAARSAVAALASLANFCGTGAHTTLGLGQTRVGIE